MRFIHFTVPLFFYLYTARPIRPIEQNNGHSPYRTVVVTVCQAFFKNSRFNGAGKQQLNSDLAGITGAEYLKRVTLIKNIAFTDYYYAVDISSYGVMPTWAFIIATVNTIPNNNAALLCAKQDGNKYITLVFDKNPGQINATLQFSVIK